MPLHHFQASLFFSTREDFADYCRKHVMRPDTEWTIVSTGVRGRGPVCKRQKRTRYVPRSPGDSHIPDRYDDRSAPDGRTRRSEEASLALDKADLSSLPIREALLHPAIDALFDCAKEELRRMDRKIRLLMGLLDEEIWRSGDQKTDRYRRLDNAIYLLDSGKRKTVLNSLCRGPSSAEVLSDMTLEMEGKNWTKVFENACKADRFLSCFARHDILSGITLAITDDGVSEGRSCFDPKERKIRTAKGDTKSLIHELGHAIEHFNPRIAERCREFLYSRTAGRKCFLLKDIYNDNRYDRSEVAIPDDFMEGYVGKLYLDGATEILSMGIEFLYDKPLPFLEQDEEHFRFIIAALRGLL